MSENSEDKERQRYVQSVGSIAPEPCDKNLCVMLCRTIFSTSTGISLHM
jgi:hypothetical protein